MIKKISKIYFIWPLFFFCFFAFSGFCLEKENNKKILTLKEKLKAAQKGDYIVTLKKDIYTLLIVNQIDSKKLFLEEVVLPQSAKKTTFQDLSYQNYPEALIWNLYQIDLDQTKLLFAYSLKQNAKIQIENSELFLIKLLTLPLEKQTAENRKKIGPPPMSGEMDNRKFWQPAKIVAGAKMEDATFSVLETIWPKDGSELSHKKIVLYFDDFFAFPYFIQVDSPQLTAFLKAVDSGHNFPTKAYKIKAY